MSDEKDYSKMMPATGGYLGLLPLMSLHKKMLSGDIRLVTIRSNGDVAEIDLNYRQVIALRDYLDDFVREVIEDEPSGGEG